MESKIKRQYRAINSCQVTTRKKNKTVAKKLTIFKVATGCVCGGGGLGREGARKRVNESRLQ